MRYFKILDFCVTTWNGCIRLFFVCFKFYVSIYSFREKHPCEKDTLISCPLHPLHQSQGLNLQPHHPQPSSYVLLSGNGTQDSSVWGPRLYSLSNTSQTLARARLSSVLASLGCYNKTPSETYTTDIYFLTSLEARILRSGYQNGWFLVRALFLTCRWLPSYYVLICGYV